MHVLALDLGTSGAKAALIDLRTGETTAACSQPHPTHTLPGGGVEQSPEDWLAAARVAVAALPTDDVAALSVTGQMQDLICLDGSGAAIGRAILYNDTRATDAATAIATEVPHWVEITGNEQNATSNAAMLRRLHDSGDPRASADAVLFSPTGYLLHRLGLGQFVDPTTASTTGLMDLATRTWSREVCAAAHCSPGTLPEIRSGHVGDTADGNAAVGELHRKAAQRHDHQRFDECNLLIQIAAASLDFVRLRIAVVGRATLDHVGDKDLVARHIDAG